MRPGRSASPRNPRRAARWLPRPAPGHASCVAPPVFRLLLPFARRLLAALALCALPLHVATAGIRIEIEGLEGEMRDAVAAALDLSLYEQREVRPRQAQRLFQRAPAQIRDALEPFGFYAPDVESSLEQEGEDYVAHFRVTPGEPVTLTASSVRVTGPGGDDPAVRAAVRAFAPRIGERLDHALYEASKQAVESALLAQGYLAEDPVRHVVEVSRARRSARIDVEWRSGVRHRFGPVRFGESQFEPRFLQRFVPWREGEPYAAGQLLTLQQRLVDTDYFASVAVQPAVRETRDASVPVDVLLAPAKRTVYTAALQLSTDAGPGVRLGVRRRWVNSRGHSASAETEQSQRLNAYSIGYRIPLAGRTQRMLNFGITSRDETTDTTRSRTERIVASQSDTWRGFSRTFGLQAVSGNFTVADERRYSKLLYPEVVLGLKRADDLNFTRRGYSATLTTRFSSKAFGSDTGFAQAALDVRWIRALTERRRVILHGSLGAMTAGNFDELPPDLRFFAGGDRSVRGYAYQSIGGRNARGLVIGGEYLVLAGAEYEHWFLPNWGAAAFVDTGDAFRGNDLQLRTGVGVGVRWRSPVGVLRLDVARPLRREFGRAFRIHVVIGPDL